MHYSKLVGTFDKDCDYYSGYEKCVRDGEGSECGRCGECGGSGCVVCGVCGVCGLCCDRAGVVGGECGECVLCGCDDSKVVFSGTLLSSDSMVNFISAFFL